MPTTTSACAVAEWTHIHIHVPKGATVTVCPPDVEEQAALGVAAHDRVVEVAVVCPPGRTLMDYTIVYRAARVQLIYTDAETSTGTP